MKRKEKESPEPEIKKVSGFTASKASALQQPQSRLENVGAQQEGNHVAVIGSASF